LSWPLHVLVEAGGNDVLERVQGKLMLKVRGCGKPGMERSLKQFGENRSTL